MESAFKSAKMLQVLSAASLFGTALKLHEIPNIFSVRFAHAKYDAFKNLATPRPILPPILASLSGPVHAEGLIEVGVVVGRYRFCNLTADDGWDDGAQRGCQKQKCVAKFENCIFSDMHRPAAPNRHLDRLFEGKDAQKWRWARQNKFWNPFFSRAGLTAHTGAPDARLGAGITRVFSLPLRTNSLIFFRPWEFLLFLIVEAYNWVCIRPCPILPSLILPRKLVRLRLREVEISNSIEADHDFF